MLPEQGLGVPRFPEDGDVQSSSSGGLHGALRGPLAETSDLGDGDLPSLSTGQWMAKHLAAQSQGLLVGWMWTRPRPWYLISLPCWFVARFIPGPFSMTVATESQVVPPTESWHSRPLPALLTAG